MKSQRFYLSGKLSNMKAAVLYSQGEMPQYVDFPEPVVRNEDEVLVSVQAVALKHFDKGRAKGRALLYEWKYTGSENRRRRWDLSAT
jgi:NADPH:quinone reductase-like Zn-dependent oxidoreductase